jgi:hypothetical protein
MLAAVAVIGMAGTAMAQQSPAPELGVTPLNVSPMGANALRLGHDLGLLFAAMRSCPGDREVTTTGALLVGAMRSRLLTEVTEPRWQDAATGGALLTERLNTTRPSADACAQSRLVVGRIAMEHMAR